MDPVTVTVLVASGAGAISSVAATIFTAVAARLQRKEKLRASAAQPVDQVLETNDLAELGRFMDDTVGEFDVSEYVASTEVSQTIDRYLQGVVDFLGTDSDVSEDEAVREPLPAAPEPSRILESEPLMQVVEDLTNGETWNALARLRRILEVALRDRALALGFADRHLKSAGQILRLLSDRDHLPPDIGTSLRYAIAVCNRAVHGREVSPSEAEEALWIVERSLIALAAQHLSDSMDKRS